MSGTRGEAASLVRSARARSAAIDKALFIAGLHRSVGREPILVYTMSKTGSSALAGTVAEVAGRPTLKVHNISREQHRAGKRWWHEHASDRHLPFLWRADYARLRVVYDRRVRRWTVISGVREPVARSVSGLFQVGERAGFLSPETPAPEVDLDRLRAAYIETFQHPHDWFRTELQPVTGIDVYAVPFDHDRGHQTYESSRFRQLLIRQEDLATAGPQALAEFLGVDTVELPKANAGADKGYRELYQRFVREVRLPEEVVESLYATELARHFYTPAELDGFRERWLR